MRRSTSNLRPQNQSREGSYDNTDSPARHKDLPIEYDNRDYYLPKREPGGFTISKVPRFTNEKFREHDMDQHKSIKTFPVKDNIQLG